LVLVVVVDKDIIVMQVLVRMDQVLLLVQQHPLAVVEEEPELMILLSQLVEMELLVAVAVMRLLHWEELEIHQR